MNNDKAFELEIIGLLIYTFTWFLIPINLIGLTIFLMGLKMEEGK